MNTVKGDLIKLALNGKFDVIIHGCNCYCTMGAGIAKTIKHEFPEAYKADCKTEKGNESKLGSYSSVAIYKENHQITVVNAYTQYNYKGKGVKADYEAVRSVFKSIKNDFSGKRIGYPKIGAGLAGGDWNIISKIIDDELKDENHTLVEFSS
ncbi:MAG: macro domain-containing protein [Deltaproteobacteria bacterium]|nr:macro domain-containing protein [Deltaproteobacteria bacterium]MBW2660538.1 macro domain-containing protein [Deltaproteobacteria bacterium]